MKKLILTTLVAIVLCGSAFAQKGEKSVALTINYATEIETAGLDLKFNYNITDVWRVAPSFTYFFPKKTHGVTTNCWAINADVHYLFPLSAKFTVFPLAGLSFLHAGAKVPSLLGGNDKVTDNDVALNLGGGVEYSLTSSWALVGDVRFKIKSETLFMIGVGAAYKF